MVSNLFWFLSYFLLLLVLLTILCFVCFSHSTIIQCPTTVTLFSPMLVPVLQTYSISVRTIVLLSDLNNDDQKTTSRSRSLRLYLIVWFTTWLSKWVYALPLIFCSFYQTGQAGDGKHWFKLGSLHYEWNKLVERRLTRILDSLQ